MNAPVDIALIRKYDKPGPRYTSYPTALHFSDQFNREHYLQAIEQSNTRSDPISLYFHIPYCDTLCYYCGCNMIISKDRNRIQRYENYLHKEIQLLQQYLNPNREVFQLHWGGGTPTYLLPEQITRLIQTIRHYFKISASTEMGCEIDPRGLERDHLVALKEGGFNRISMGVQDFNETVQKAVNRIQSEELTRQVVQWIRELRFHSLNLDLIYGLPFQTVTSFCQTLDRIIDIAPDRIALFNYAHVPWMKKHMELILEKDLPAPEEKLEILKMSIEKLTSAGYVFIGMDHFARPENELAVALKEKKLGRNFQGYTTHAGLDLYGLGITSISQLSQTYAQNVKTEKEYYQILDQNLLPTTKGYTMTPEDILRRDLIMRLMCHFELDFASFENQYGIEFEKYFSEALTRLEEMIQDELLSIHHRKIVISDKGRLLIRNIAMNFDAYLEKKSDAKRVYSKTV